MLKLIDQESESLIGSILAEDETQQNKLKKQNKDNNNPNNNNSSNNNNPNNNNSNGPIIRSTSAPPQLALSGESAALFMTNNLTNTSANNSSPTPITINGETVLSNDPRLTLEYYTYYYSQKPLDPRLPVPLVNWANHPQLQHQQNKFNENSNNNNSSSNNTNTNNNNNNSLKPSVNNNPNSNSISPNNLSPAQTTHTIGRSILNTNNSTPRGGNNNGDNTPSNTSSPVAGVESLNRSVNKSPGAAFLNTAIAVDGNINTDLSSQFNSLRLASPNSSSKTATNNNNPSGTNVSNAPVSPNTAANSRGPTNPLMAVLGFAALNQSNNTNVDDNLAVNNSPVFGGLGLNALNAMNISRTNSQDYSVEDFQAINNEFNPYAQQHNYYPEQHNPNNWATQQFTQFNPYAQTHQHIINDYPQQNHENINNHRNQHIQHNNSNRGGGNRNNPSNNNGDRRGGRGGKSNRGRGNRDNQHNSNAFHQPNNHGDPTGAPYPSHTTHHRPLNPHQSNPQFSPYSSPPSGPIPYISNPHIPPVYMSAPNLVQPSNQFMDDFRLNKQNLNHLLLTQISDAPQVLCELACDQHGSRFIQQRVELSDGEEEKQIAYMSLVPETLRLSVDVFGNYVIQKLLEFGNVEQRKSIVAQLVGSVYMLSLQQYGCRVVQKALEVTQNDPDTQLLMLREINGHVLQCVRDSNANHVIQQAVQFSSNPQHTQFIPESLYRHIYNLSCHPFGCRVIQRLIEHCIESTKDTIISEILLHLEDMCRNQYANYVIQHCLMYANTRAKNIIVNYVKSRILQLSKHKFASNIVEQAFVQATPADKAGIIDEVLGKLAERKSADPLSITPSPGSGCLLAMVRDQFANYVVQRILEASSAEQRADIVQRMRWHVVGLKSIPYGKVILSKVESLTGEPLLPLEESVSIPNILPGNNSPEQQ